MAFPGLWAHRQMEWGQTVGWDGAGGGGKEGWRGAGINSGATRRRRRANLGIAANAEGTRASGNMTGHVVAYSKPSNRNGRKSLLFSTVANVYVAAALERSEMAETLFSR